MNHEENDWNEAFAAMRDPEMDAQPSSQAETTELPFKCRKCELADAPEEQAITFHRYVQNEEGNTPYDGEQVFPSAAAAAEWMIDNNPNPNWQPYPLNAPSGYEYEDGWGATLILTDHTEEQAKALLAAYYAELALVRRPFLCEEERF